MKKVVLNYLSIAVVSVSALFMSCSNEKVQLLESITYGDGSFEKYEYDKENRITKTSQYDKEGILAFSKTVSYSGSDFIKVVMGTGISLDYAAIFEFSKNGNKITITFSNDNDDVETVTIDLDKDGFPTKYESMNDSTSSVGSFEVHDGNLTKHSYKIQDGETLLEGISEYKYDNQKSPLYHCKTPKWWWIISDGRSTQNNVIEIFDNHGKKVEYKYEFDKAGYPTKCTAKGNNGEHISMFKYK